MNQTIRINTSIFQDFARHFLGKNLTVQDRQEIALKAMAIVELSPNGNYNFSTPNHGMDKIMLKAEEQHPEIFVNNGRHILSERPNDIFLLKMISTLSGYTNNGLWTFENKKAMILDILLADKDLLRSHAILFKNGVYELCGYLFNQAKGDIYLPFDEELYNSVEFTSHGSQVFTETPQDSSFSPMINLLLDNVNHHVADPVINPSYVMDGKLQTFAKGLVVGPWGMKVDPKTFDNSRFAVGGNTYQNYLIQHLFAQVSDLALVFVPQNTLTSSVGADIEFREWLINQKHLKTVISLPSGLIANTGVACSLMLFDLKNQYDNVRFISLKDTTFVQKNHLVNTKTLANIINGDNFDNAICIRHHEIANKNFVLDPERYVLDDESKKAVGVLSKYQTMKLGEIADIIRPAPITKFKDEGDEGVLEIQGGDLPSYGYITTASKQTFVSPKALRSITSSEVQAGDIIMTIRGSTGKVGLVSQALIDSSDLPMVVGQTGVIIRPNTDKINPIALYMQLHSKFAQSRLALLSVGSAIAGLSVKDLKEFDIAQLSKADEQILVENFEKQCLINDEILQKQQVLAELSEQFWN